MKRPSAARSRKGNRCSVATSAARQTFTAGVSEPRSGNLFVGVQPETFDPQSTMGYQLSCQPAMRPPLVSAHIWKPKASRSPAKWR
jgi:hypothetical protein